MLFHGHLSLSLSLSLPFSLYTRAPLSRQKLPNPSPWNSPLIRDIHVSLWLRTSKSDYRVAQWTSGTYANSRTREFPTVCNFHPRDDDADEERVARHVNRKRVVSWNFHGPRARRRFETRRDIYIYVCTLFRERIRAKCTRATGEHACRGTWRRWGGLWCGARSPR